VTDDQIEEFLRFVRDVQSFMDDEELAANPAHAVAVLVRETAVAAFVRGTMWSNDVAVPVPSDSEMMRQARDTARMNPDLYPAWSVLDRAHVDGDEG
jgi:hypothetical protein